MTPFGFSADGPDENKDENRPEDFNAMMRQMQEQIQEQLKKLGVNPAGFINPLAGFTGGESEPLPQSVVRDVARKFVTAHGSQPIGVKDVTVVDSALEIADIWLNESTLFPSTDVTGNPRAVSRSDWTDITLKGWQATMEPLAIGLTTAITALLDEAISNNGSQFGEDSSEISSGSIAPIGAIAALLRSFIGSMIATQLGQSIGGIAATATGAHDAGLPLLEPARPLLIPENIDEWSKDLEIPKSEVYIFHALREAAIARLFQHNPWIVGYIRSAIVEYGRGIHIDLEAIQRQAEEAMGSMDPSLFDPSQFDPTQFNSNNPANAENSFTIALNNGIFTPEETPAQKSALSKLETVLALVDGWADDVATTAAGDRLPSITALREIYRRSRATNAPAQQLFKSLLGLEVRPKLVREASAFWQKIREAKGIEVRDQMWSGILPTESELLAPELFIASSEIPDDLSGLL